MNMKKVKNIFSLGHRRAGDKNVAFTRLLFLRVVKRIKTIFIITKVDTRGKMAWFPAHFMQCAKTPERRLSGSSTINTTAYLWLMYSFLFQNRSLFFRTRRFRVTIGVNPRLINPPVFGTHSAWFSRVKRRKGIGTPSLFVAWFAFFLRYSFLCRHRPIGPI